MIGKIAFEALGIIEILQTTFLCRFEDRRRLLARPEVKGPSHFLAVDHARGGAVRGTNGDDPSLIVDIAIADSGVDAVRENDFVPVDRSVDRSLDRREVSGDVDDVGLSDVPPGVR